MLLSVLNLSHFGVCDGMCWWRMQERLSASSNAASRCTSQATGTADSLHSFVDPFCFEHMGSGLIYPDRAPPGTCDKTAAALPAGQRAGDVQLSGTGASGVWVLKWVDYSCKYGLGYEMSDGGCGVVFNDGSKLIQSHSGERVEYREHERQDTSQAADPVQVLTASASHPMAVPEKLRKKVRHEARAHRSLYTWLVNVPKEVVLLVLLYWRCEHTRI